jgi:hypothetical protein
VPKGHPPSRLGWKPKSSPFRNAATFVAKIRAAGCMCLQIPLSLSGWVRGIPTPSALKWPKSSFTEFSEVRL